MICVNEFLFLVLRDLFLGCLFNFKYLLIVNGKEEISREKGFLGRYVVFICFSRLFRFFFSAFRLFFIV